MKRGAALKTYARLERGAPMERGEQLRATQWGTRKRPKAASWRDEFMPERMAPDAPKYTAFELAWFAFVRTMPCVRARYGCCDGPIQAAHITLSADEKGTSLKVDHTQTAPMCKRCHDYWDGRLGRKGNPFNGMSKAQRYARGAGWVDDVRKAATPQERDDAEHFQELGLGRILELGGGRFGWLRGDREDEAAA